MLIVPIDEVGRLIVGPRVGHKPMVRRSPAFSGQTIALTLRRRAGLSAVPEQYSGDRRSPRMSVHRHRRSQPAHL